MKSYQLNILILFFAGIAQFVYASSQPEVITNDVSDLDNIPIADCQAGLKAYEEHKYSEAIMLWEDLSSYKGLGERYGIVNKCLIGTGIVKTESELIDWYKSAASNGVVEAETLLAEKYYRSENPFKGALDRVNHPELEPKMSETIFWAKKAMEHRHPDGKYLIATLYIQGLGLGKNIDLGVKLMEEAAKEGSMSACVYLILMYKRGVEGKYKDHEKEQYWREYSQDLAERIGSISLSY